MFNPPSSYQGLVTSGEQNMLPDTMLRPWEKQTRQLTRLEEKSLAAALDLLLFQLPQINFLSIFSQLLPHQCTIKHSQEPGKQLRSWKCPCREQKRNGWKQQHLRASMGKCFLTLERETGTGVSAGQCPGAGGTARSVQLCPDVHRYCREHGELFLMYKGHCCPSWG